MDENMAFLAEAIIIVGVFLFFLRTEYYRL